MGLPSKTGQGSLTITQARDRLSDIEMHLSLISLVICCTRCRIWRNNYNRKTFQGTANGMSYVPDCRICRIVSYAGQKCIGEIGQIQGTAKFVLDMAKCLEMSVMPVSDMPDSTVVHEENLRIIFALFGKRFVLR